MGAVPDIGYGRAFDGFYDKIFPGGPFADLAVERLAALHLGGGPRALELGVGTGRIAIPLSSRAGGVTGVDSSPEMLETLGQRLREYNEGTEEAGDADVTAVHADIRDYTDDERYALVYCVCATLSMILDADEQRRTIRHAAERLAPGGALVVETHNANGIVAMHEGRQRTSFFVPYPEPDSGLLTYSTLTPGGKLWTASHVWFEKGTSRVATEHSRLTSPQEVDGYAADAGLRPADRWGDWSGGPYEEEGPLFVSVYTNT